MSSAQISPDTALQRAQELETVGQSAAALQLLYDVLTFRRTRTFSPAHETMMLRFLTLAVEARKGRVAKEALHQYRNMTQNTHVSSLETVFKHWISLSEEKVIAAQASVSTLDVDEEDFEGTPSPESLVWSTARMALDGEASIAGQKDRTERALVTPCLKFLWEVYRTVLDILKNNARLEALYHTVVRQAFEFCLKYQRKIEFRRLCELLRVHLQSIVRFSAPSLQQQQVQQQNSLNLRNPETLQLFLRSRFLQLKAAEQLDLWQEAFRSIEDIHGLLEVGGRHAMLQPLMMRDYYSVLAKAFLVSGNQLYNAAAWHQLYQITCQHNKQLTPAMRQSMASMVLLSTLAIPIISPSKIRTSGYEWEDTKSQEQRLTQLMRLSKAPTRASLLQDAMHKSVLKFVAPELRLLCHYLEVEFHPLLISERIAPIVSKLTENKDYLPYLRPLHEVALTRLLQQLSQVYSTLKMESLQKLASFAVTFGFDQYAIEKFIMLGNRKGDLHICVDHASKSYHFRSAEHQQIEAQSSIADWAKQLVQIQHCIQPPLAADASRAFAQLRDGLLEEHERTLARRLLIERKKEIHEFFTQRRERAANEAKMKRAAAEAEAERQRVAEESRRRELERMQRERDEIAREEARRLAEEMRRKWALTGRKMDESLLQDGLDKETLVQRQMQQLEQERQERDAKVRALIKRLDHTERAMRLEQISLLQTAEEQQQQADRDRHAQQCQQWRETAERQHAQDLQAKQRFVGVLLQDYRSYRDSLEAARQEAYQQRVAETNKALQAAKAALLLQRQEEHEQRVAERQLALKKKEEAAQRDAEKRAKEEAERAAYAERKRQLDELAERQRQREAEIEAKLREKESAVPAVAAPVQTPSSTGPAWRSKAAAEGGDAWRRPSEQNAAPVSSSTAPSGSYRPPQRRTDERGDDQWRRADNQQRPTETKEPAKESPSGMAPRFVAGSSGKPSWRDREAAKKSDQK